MKNTLEQFDQAVQRCRNIFLQKISDYGTAWSVLRPISIVDQLFIKAQRIRTIQLKRDQRVKDDITGEFIGMVNYSVIGLIQLECGIEEREHDPRQVTEWYDRHIASARETMENKNHDYGEAWRDMSQESFTDLILMKLLRMKQIISNDGKTLISEGIDANYTDIINYALFALILIEEGKHSG